MTVIGRTITVLFVKLATLAIAIAPNATCDRPSPMKEKRFKEVSFVYVTSSTSPRPKYNEMIGNIKGDHYYLTDNQLDVIYKQLETNVFPTYIIVDRDGKIVKKYIGFAAIMVAAFAQAGSSIEKVVP